MQKPQTYLVNTSTWKHHTILFFNVVAIRKGPYTFEILMHIFSKKSFIPYHIRTLNEECVPYITGDSEPITYAAAFY